MKNDRAIDAQKRAAGSAVELTRRTPTPTRRCDLRFDTNPESDAQSRSAADRTYQPKHTSNTRDSEHDQTTGNKAEGRRCVMWVVSDYGCVLVKRHEDFGLEEFAFLRLDELNEGLQTHTRVSKRLQMSTRSRAGAFELTTQAHTQHRTTTTPHT